MALTTLQYWQQQQTFYQQAQASALGDLTVAQAAQQSANKQLALDLDALDKVTGDIAKKRAQLAVTTIPADANALVVQITAAIIQQRGLQGKVLDGRDAIDAALASLDAANATLTRVKARIASLQTKVTQSISDDTQRHALKNAASTASLDTLKSDANTLVTSDTVTKNALGGLKKNFPDEIIEITRLRYQQRSQRWAKLQDALDSAQISLGNGLATDAALQGTANQKLADFQRAQDKLASYVATASDRYNKAKATMLMLEAIGLDNTPNLTGILTKAEHDQLTLVANATQGKAALGLAEPLAVAAQAALKKANDDKATAVQKAADLLKAKNTADGKILAAGLAAEKAADPAATAADKAAAKTAADNAFAAQSDAHQASIDKDNADIAAANSATAAKTAIDKAAASPKASSIGICLDAVYQAQDDLVAQTLFQIYAGVDALGTDPEIAKKRLAITNAIATFNAAITTFAAANKGDLDQWEAIIPDTAWKVLLDYQEGLAALKELAIADPATLVQDMEKKETDYTAVLAEADKAQRRVDNYGDVIGLYAGRLAAAQAAITARLPSAIRGDTY